MSNTQEEMMEEFEDEDTQKDKFLTFILKNDTYGLDISYVTEIVVIQTITDIPDMPEHIKGIINLRGKIIPVMDVRLRFKKNPRKYDERTCIIVVDTADISIGLIVDRVAEVIIITDDNISPPPKINDKFRHRYIKGIAKVGEDVKLILDCEKLLNDDEILELEEII